MIILEVNKGLQEAMAEDSIINEDAIAKVENQFQLDDIHYTILLDDHRKDFDFQRILRRKKLENLSLALQKVLTSL